MWWVKRNRDDSTDVMNPDPVKLLVEALRAYSPSGKESVLAEILRKQIKALGYSDVIIDNAGNVQGEVGQGRRRLLLCGHMDTVPGELPVRIRGDTIYGRGASDAKAPLYAMLLAGSMAANAGIRVTFAGVTDEEGDGRGIDELVRRGQRFDFAVFGEPGSARKVTIGYRGRVSVNVSVRTQGGHASSPWANVSAFDEFIKVLSELKDYERSRSTPGDHYRSISITPTLVRSGEYQNVVPGTCEVTLDLRIPPGFASADVLNDIRNLAGTSLEGTRVRISHGRPTEPYESQTDSTLVRSFQRAILLRLKAKPALVRKTGTGDMNTFAQSTGTKCVTYGPGDSRLSHSDHESVSIGDYRASIEVLDEAIRQLASLEG